MLELYEILKEDDANIQSQNTFNSMYLLNLNDVCDASDGTEAIANDANEANPTAAADVINSINTE